MSDAQTDSTNEAESASRDESNDSAKSERKGIKPAKEIGGREGPDPTRYGDWEKAGRCIDF